MFPIEYYLPQIHLSSKDKELIEFQISENQFLTNPTEDRFAVLGIFLPDESIFSNNSDKKYDNFKLEFVLSTSENVSSHLSQLCSKSFSKKFPLITPGISSISPGKMVLKLSAKVKADVSMVNESDEIISIEPSKVPQGSIALVEGLFKHYTIPGSSSGTVLELSSMIILAQSSQNMVPSPTKRKIKEFLEQRKKEKVLD
jgi:hypothetical protein